ncbi:hypothetical protein ACFQI3_05725 [Hansschlegelia quercus]|uniref:Proteophosphoglycan ppg4 n=1 Tax=Hansschlegelia quercus TaxID=2528245 RepID=A0A4Q9GKR9_9HYPH|nr:hypothetical protein [Hansschlegelia quercus]TBN53931.1 hypothetical protein EYR15_09120 [Hansschlegelia quercus]
MKYSAALLAVLLSTGAAFAQTTPSTVDPPAAAGKDPQSDPKQTSPGATGAMQHTAPTIATSPQEVREQNKGTGDAGKGATSPGTVGATPGDDPAQPKPK